MARAGGVRAVRRFPWAARTRSAAAERVAGRPVSVMDANELKRLYERQFGEDLEPPVRDDVNPREALAMLRASRGIAAGVLRERCHQRIWIWSDLHLGHSGAISVFGRPFDNPGDMDDRLFGVWRRTVRPDDTIICLGDVVFSGRWGGRRGRVLAAPGRKILVFGNHELGNAGVAVPGFDEIYGVLYAAGDPPLLMTHFPLRWVPEGCVNLHGHLHNATMPGSARHINVCVEQVHYRPRPLTAIRRLARCLVRGEVVPGRTTAHQLTHVG